MKLQLHYYLWKLNQALYGMKKEEKRGILDMVKDGAKIYLQEHPQCSFHGLTEYFGEPEKVATYYLPDDAVPKKRFLATKPIVRMFVYMFCCVAILFAVFFLGLFLLQTFAPDIPVHITK